MGVFSFLIFLVVVGGGVLWLLHRLSTGRSSSLPHQDPLQIVGGKGVAQENFVTDGVILMSGELWRAESCDGIIARGEFVEVTEVLPELRVKVKKLQAKEGR